MGMVTGLGGDFAHFVEYNTGAVMSLFPSSLTVSFAPNTT